MGCPNPHFKAASHIFFQDLSAMPLGMEGTRDSMNRPSFGERANKIRVEPGWFV